MLNPMYSDHADDYAAAIRNNSYNAHYERPSLLALLPDLKEKAVIDLGCGPGVYAEYLLSQGARVTAVDRSPEMVALVKQNLGEAVACYEQDLVLGLPQEADGVYNLAICPLAIHYLEDFTPLFRDVRRVLKPGGLFVFSTHHPFVDYPFSPSGNYFLTEKIVDEWDTVGRPVKVEFYRRPLSAIIQPVLEAGMMLVALSEGKPDPQMEQTDPDSFRKLSTEPGFLFVKCQAM
ncbi:class I SAM-dependent DNA methyltransferase [Gimesia fumaroli]|uniref:Malonyl-[acyl-carrier protein] O-methyltransferase n=1 Tax=Gimesia fumaroli TaxID=2527976 RepID=A0A518IAZ9_9PLAN|nr:class I SAM-dependent methyltransferase [Gimesia fumaroli]QDV50275.1 Malonyl-[acyl-carrier protein] O-methyltransferase [Gimesia fumaroli]